MARPDVRKQIELPGAGNARGIECRLRLIVTVEGDTFGYASNAHADVGGVRVARPNPAGLVTFTSVRPNYGVSVDVITSPAGTVYELVTRFSDGRHTIEHIAVPDVAGPVWVQDILTALPADLPSLVEQTQDIVASMIRAGANTTVTYDDLTGTITISVVGAVYRHVQTTPATSWPVGHGLGYWPNVSVLTTAGDVCLAGVEHVDNNNLIVSLLVPMAGFADCS